MNLTPVTTINTEALSIYKQLRDRNLSHDNSFIADTPKVVNLLLTQDIEVKSILATQEYYDTYQDLLSLKKIPLLYVAERSILEQIVGHKVHHNVMMHGLRPPAHTLSELGDKIIMLDEISSTENIGSIARSAAALGVDSYLLPKQGPHPFNRRALRVSMGHAALLKIHQYENILETIATLQADGYTVFGAEVSDDAIGLRDAVIPKKWVLLMGHEGKGLSQDVLDACDQTLVIEMVEGIKSFNVSVAASIMMYHFLK